MDEYFQSWVFRTGGEGVERFWEAWLVDHPEKTDVIRDARTLLNAVKFEKHALSADQLDELWRRIQNVEYPSDVKTGASSTGKWYAAAASVLVLCAVGLLYYWNVSKPWQEFNTRYAETRNVILPDGSSVILNANSKLTLHSDWNNDDAREIWLDGEAFFSVIHKADNKPFKVHTKEGVVVEVLGTTFNVYNRTNGTKVVLNTGQIRLNLPTDQTPETILMKPGDMVEYKELRYKKKEVDPQLYSAWTSNKIILDHTSLSEMVHMLQDSYGLEVKVDNPAILLQTVSGSMPLGDADILLNQMAKAFQLSIHKEGAAVIIEELNSEGQ